MTRITNSRSEFPARLDRALENVVIQNWNELMPDPKSGLVHIEYQTGPDGAVTFLLVWASTVRGYWDLVCELWMQPLWSHNTGIRFGSGYSSLNLGHQLQAAIEQERDFAKLPDLHRLVQVFPPSQERLLGPALRASLDLNVPSSQPATQGLAA